MVRVFSEWLVNEVGLVRHMRPVTPVGNFNVKDPTAGDIVIDNPAVFFKSPNKNRTLQPIAANLFFVAGAKDGKLATRNISQAKPPIAFDPKDLVDITFFVPAEARRVLPQKESNVFIYLPPLPQYEPYRAKVEQLRKRAALTPEDEKEAVGRMQAALGVGKGTLDPVQAANYAKIERRAEEMLKMGQDPSMELKRAFADEQNISPAFVQNLRKNGFHIIADFLEGKTPTLRSNPLASRMQVAAMPTRPRQDDRFDKMFQRAAQPQAPVDDNEAKWNQMVARAAKQPVVNPQAQVAWKKAFGESRFKYYPI